MKCCQTGRGKIGRFIKDINGDAVVEATILFPIMILIFAALVLLAVFLPARAVLQRATQYAATAIATGESDTWLFYDESLMSYFWETEKSRLPNVYTDLFFSGEDIQLKGEGIVAGIESRSISSKAGTLDVVCNFTDGIVYKEIIVTATREFIIPGELSLSFIGFPGTIPVTATSTAVELNADEFVRSIDIACDFAEFIADKYGLHDVTEAISKFGKEAAPILGWQ